MEVGRLGWDAVAVAGVAATPRSDALLPDGLRRGLGNLIPAIASLWITMITERYVLMVPPSRCKQKASLWILVTPTPVSLPSEVNLSYVRWLYAEGKVIQS